jgi:(S)-ureidoglycine aminohydrolase
MHNLGATRSVNRRDHLLQTPDTFVRTPIPGLQGGAAIVHVGPRTGAAFTQYTVEFESGGTLEPAAAQRFIYVLSGTIDLVSEASFNSLAAGAYAYLPPALDYTVTAQGPTRIAMIEKSYQAIADVPPPGFLAGIEADVLSTALMGDADLQVRSLLPDLPGFDFAVNTMTYQPGAALCMVEMHVMEHGLLMLEGGGIYRLGEEWYPVKAGDFIWMAPFCPQWFGALGKKPAKYLIYKDWNRHPLG